MVGRRGVGLIIPPDYTDQLRSGGMGQVVFILDGSDPTVASTALSSAQLIGQSLSTQIIAERWPAAARLPARPLR